MLSWVLHRPYCQGIDIMMRGKSPEGKQWYRCRQSHKGLGRMFLLVYAYIGQSPEAQRSIVENGQARAMWQNRTSPPHYQTDAANGAGRLNPTIATPLLIDMDALID